MAYTAKIALTFSCIIAGIYLFLNYGISEIDAKLSIDLGSVAYINSIRHDSRYKDKAAPKKIAIVGAGMGGSSTAYFMRKQFGDDVTIDLFEKTNHVGGRVATVEMGGRLYESGGSILHPKNMYAKSLSELFELMPVSDDTTTVGFFDGKDYVLKTSEWTIVSFARMLWQFGFDIFRLNQLEEVFMELFCQIYKKHETGESFSSVETLITAMGKQRFVNATRITSRELLQENNIGENMVDILVNAGLRVNYGQSASTVNGFVGLVSMAGIQSGMWNIFGGNDQLSKKMKGASNVNLIEERVKNVSYGRDKFSLATYGDSGLKYYDIVVIATPINQDKSSIDLSSACSEQYQCPSATKDVRHFKRTVATFIKGEINSKLFQCDSAKSCPLILTTNNNLFFRSLNYHLPVDFDVNSDNMNVGVYKVFSDKPLTTEQLNILFDNYNKTETVDWFAYPEYSPPDKLDSFVLNDKGLYYTSPIEWVASAMEMSIISGKNAALLAFNNWYDMNENVNPREKINLNENAREDL